MSVGDQSEIFFQVRILNCLISKSSIYSYFFFISLFGISIPDLTTIFGLLEPSISSSSFGTGLDTLGSGCFALALAAINLPAFCGAGEDPDYRKIRRYSNLVFWCAQIVTFTHYPENGSFFDVWVVLALSMVVLIERDIHI